MTLTATQTGVRLVVDHKVTLQAGDPLIDEIRSAKVTGSELTSYLLGDFDYTSGVDLTLKSNSMLPILEFGHEQTTAIVRFGFAAEGDDPVRFGEIEEPEGIHYVIQLEDVQKASVPAALASTRTWTVHAGGFRIVGVRGQPVNQDSTTVVFQGPPDRTSVAFQRDMETALQLPIPSATEQSSPSLVSPIVLGPFDRLVFLVTEGWLAWALTLMLPWFVLLFGADGTTNPTSMQVRRVALFVLILFSVIGIVTQYLTSPADTIGAVELTMIAPALVSAAVLHFGGWPWMRRLLVVQTATAMTAMAVGLTLALSSESTVDYGMFVAALVIGGCAVAGLGGLLFDRWGALAGASLGVAIVSAAIVGTQLDSVKMYTLEQPLVGFLVLGVLGLLAANATTAVVQFWQPRRPTPWTAISFVAGALLFLPVVRLLHDPVAAVNIMTRWIYYYYEFWAVASLGMIILNILLSIISLGILRRYGRDANGVQEPLAWSFGVALVVCLAYNSKPFSWADLSGVVALWIALWWLLPPSRRTEAAQLGAVTSRAHARLVRAETRRRIAQLGAHDLYRRARARLAAEEVKLDAYNRRQRILDDAASLNDKRIDKIPLGCALGTSAGCTPWQNALASVAFAVPIAGVIMAYEIWTLIENNEGFRWFLETVTLLDSARHLARWFGYALLFGYFYPLLRGRTPVIKALALSLAIFAAEVPPILAALSSEASRDAVFSGLDLATAVGIRTGQVIVFCFVLGLAWERRLGHLAGFTWDRLRNIRSVRALAAPATTVAIAAATGLATALAGAVVAGLLATNSNQVPEFNPPGNSNPSVPPSSTSLPR